MDSTVKKCLFSVVVIALMLAAFGGLSFAQDVAEEEKPGVPEEQIDLPIAVGEITVTARKVEENIQDVPVAVSTLQGEDLDVLTTGGADVRALSGRVPSLVMESSFGRAFPRFYIRGLGNPDFDLNASQPVSMIVDDVVLENPIVKGMPLFDIQQVEVAARTPGHALRSQHPRRDRQVRHRQTVAGVGRLRQGLLRHLRHLRHPGWSRFCPLGDLVRAALRRLSVAERLGRPTSTNPVRRTSSVVTTPPPGAPSSCGSPMTISRVCSISTAGTWTAPRGSSAPTSSNREATTSIPDFDQESVWHDGQNKQEISSFGGVLKLEYDFGDMTLTSITGYESLETCTAAATSTAATARCSWARATTARVSSRSRPSPPTAYRTSTSGLRSSGSPATAGENWNWLVGVFYFNEDLQVDTFSYDCLRRRNADDGFAFQSRMPPRMHFFGSIDWRVGRALGAEGRNPLLQ